MKIKDVLYIIFMIVFMLLSYFLFDRGINTKTKNIVTYQENSDVIYKVYLHDNNIYQKNYLNMNERYIADMVDYIDLEFDYDSLFNKDISGYYSYSVIGNLVAYEKDVNNILLQKQYLLSDLNAKVLDQNDIREINIDDKVIIDYDLYKEEIAKFKKDYGIDVTGYLEIVITIDENLSFAKIEDNRKEEKEIKVVIPLGYETFKINVINDNNKVGSYYDFSKKERVNYLLIFFGIFSVSIALSFLALTIRNVIRASKIGFNYQKELKRIFNEYDDIIVTVKRFYNKKKYNLIYLNSFDELIDVYKKCGNPISFREIRKDKEAIFLMTEDDNAWIYRMVNKK